MSSRDRRSGSINPLFVLALTTDLLAPFLIWKGILPEYARWISHALVAVMMFGAYTRMMVFDWIPSAVWAILGISAMGTSVALLQGQGLAATAWGWWILFQYPMVGLYAYLEPYWPERFPQRLGTFCTVILGMQVIVQIGQYLTGEPPGDNLAGTFGWHGTGDLVIFTLLVLCLALGRWLAHQKWTMLIWVLGLGSVSSSLGEMKLFPFAALALGMLAITIFVLRRRQMLKLVPYVVILGAVALVFFGFYNLIVPEAQSKPIESFLEVETLDSYLNKPDWDPIDGEYHNIGRNYVIVYGWDTIREGTMTFLFGLGLGARGESRTLGVAGGGLTPDHLWLSTGTSLVVVMQELGLVGIVVIGGFILWAVMALFKDIRNDPQSDAIELRYALLLFSLLWPLWLWYNVVLRLRVPMLLYWMALGYVLSEPHGHFGGIQHSHRGILSLQCVRRTPRNE